MAARQSITEAAFQSQFIELAHLFGWKVAHFRPAQTARGWRTPVQGDGKGFPDNVLVRGSRVIVAELKSDTGKPTPEQKDWLAAFEAAGVECYVWKPCDLDEIAAVLRCQNVAHYARVKS